MYLNTNLNFLRMPPNALQYQYICIYNLSLQKSYLTHFYTAYTYPLQKEKFIQVFTDYMANGMQLQSGIFVPEYNLRRNSERIYPQSHLIYIIFK